MKNLYRFENVHDETGNAVGIVIRFKKSSGDWKTQTFFNTTIASLALSDFIAEIQRLESLGYDKEHNYEPLSVAEKYVWLDGDHTI